MPAFVQLDLFGDRPELDRPSEDVPAAPIAPERLSEEDLISAIPDVSLAGTPEVFRTVARWDD